MAGQDCGIVYVAWGEKYVQEAIQSAQRVIKACGYPCVLITREPLEEPHPFSHIILEPLEGSYRDKILMRKSPFAKTIFLDSDTHVLASLDDVFQLLERFDIGYQPTSGGLHYSLPGVPMEAFPEPSAGIIVWSKNKRTDAFFDLWDRFYLEHQAAYGDGAWDQRSMRQAVWESEVSVAILSTAWQLYTFAPATLLGQVKMIHGRNKVEPVLRAANDILADRIFIPELGFHRVFAASPMDYFRLAVTALRAGMKRSARLALHHSKLWRLPSNDRPM